MRAPTGELDLVVVINERTDNSSPMPTLVLSTFRGGNFSDTYKGCLANIFRCSYLPGEHLPMLLSTWRASSDAL